MKNNYQNFSYMAPIAKFSEEESTDRNIPLGLLQAGTGLYIGQQAIRSGVPRALGVRLESHSTSHKNAKDILANGGILDPNRSGTGSMGALDVAHRQATMEADLPPFLQDSTAKELASRKEASAGKVFITGKHPDKQLDESTRQVIKQLTGGLDVNNPTMEAFYKKNQRAAYRTQSGLTINPNDYVYHHNYANDRNAEVLKSAMNPLDNYKKGRSLYVGGSDDYFRNNFHADVDDPLAMMTSNRVKVSGNRFGAVKDAIDREGLVNLIKSNPKRVAVGAGILAGGSLLAGLNLKGAYHNLAGKKKQQTDSSV